MWGIWNKVRAAIKSNPKAAEIIHKVESNPIAKKALESEAVKKAQAKAEETVDKLGSQAIDKAMSK